MLEKLYCKTKSLIDSVDFSGLWRGFHPMKFALYDETRCFFDGGYVEKNEQFLANTSIFYQGEYIAIWNVMEELDPAVLAPKLIHEMFHAFQNEQGESRFPNELDALWNYRYDAEYLSAKLEENRLLVGLVKKFDSNSFAKLAALRKWRHAADAYASSYEMAEEQIEGTAAYVELKVLGQLSQESFLSLRNKMTAEITRAENLFPIRVVSYSVGALLFLVLKENELLDFETFSDTPATASLLEIPTEELAEVETDSEVSMTLEQYQRETEAIVTAAVKQGDCAAQGYFDLLMLNIYNARRWGRYLVTTYFVMYADGEEKVTLHGNFVLEMDGERKISRILRAS